MANPWITKNRVYWEDDPKFKEFSDRLFDELWSFDEVLKISTVETFNFKTNKDLIFKKMKIKWLKYVDEWNEQKDVLDTTTCKGYAAVTFLFIVLPYDQLDEIGKYFTAVEMDQINVCYFYNTGGKYLKIKDVENLFERGPKFPPAYVEWLNDKYDRAAWWISYMIYEKNNNLEPIIDSVPAEII